MSALNSIKYSQQPRDKHNKQLSPCIVAWVRYAINDFSTKKPKNKKMCKKKYWDKVVDFFLNESAEDIEKAIIIRDLYDDFVNRKGMFS